MFLKRSLYIALSAAGNLFALVFFQWYLLAYLGAGRETDAHYAAIAVTQFALAVTSGVAVQTLVPLLAGETLGRSREIVWTAIWLALAFFAGLALFIGIAAEYWVGSLFPGFSSEAKLLASSLMHIQAVTMVFVGVQSVLLAFQYARDSFVWPELKTLIANIVSVSLGVVMLPSLGVYAAAYAYLLRALILTTLLFDGLGRPIFGLPGVQELRSTWPKMKPLLAGSAYFKTEDLVDRFLLSGAAPGMLSLYNVAQQMLQSANLIFSKMLSAPLMSRLSIEYKSGNAKRFSVLYKHGLITALFATVCCFIGLVLILYVGEHRGVVLGRFGSEDIGVLVDIVIVLGGFFIFGVLGQVSAIAYYSRGNTFIPTAIGVVVYTLYVPAKIYAFFEHGIYGLALATSAYYAAGVIAKMVFLKINDPPTPDPRALAGWKSYKETDL